ncbi:cutinase family protein [Nocardia takedensis]|uniref:cutinase family protein n=1 Tax=Nocardia takedensis TaxID=259390 RepID=UPI00030B76A4|nr:cutinase family protein [Nocardia takedensis]
MPTRHHTTHRRLARALLSGGLAAALTAGTGLAAAVPTPTPAGTDCPRWTAVLAPGTSETTTGGDPSRAAGVLAPVGAALTDRYGSDIAVRTHTAPDGGSETAGVEALTAVLAGLCSTTRVVLLGYSQGAHLTGDLAAAIGAGRGPVPASRIVAVGLVSDPRRDPTTPQLGQLVSGQGVLGPRPGEFGELADRVVTVCAEGDLYCSSTPETAPVLTAVGRAVTATPPTPTTPAPTNSATGPLPSTAPAPGTPGSAPIEALDPTQVLAQVVTVLAGLSGFVANVPAIVDDLAQLPGLLATSNIPGLHRVAGDLNNRFSPLVDMVAGLDLRLVARALALAAPLDSSGWVAVAAQVVNVLAGLDIARIALDIGRTQEIVWAATEALAAGDPLKAVLAVTGLAPVAADLAAATAAAFTGGALSGYSRAYTTATGPTTTAALAGLARQGSDAALVARSGVHADGYDTAAPTLIEWALRTIGKSR